MGRKMVERNVRFGRWIKGMREAREMTQTELAGYLDMTQSHIHKWEDGELVSLTPEQIRGLAKGLGVKPTEVALRFGYPVKTDATFTIPLTRDQVFERISDLNSRLHLTVEAWADEIMPPEEHEERQPNDRNG